MKHIKTKIMLAILLTASIPLLALGLISINLNQLTTRNTLEQTMLQLSKIASERIGHELNSLKVIAIETGKIARLSSPDADNETRQALIDEKVKAYSFTRGTVAGLDGIGIAGGQSHKGTDYFEASLRGETYLTEPYVDPNTDELMIVLSTPLWQDGQPGTKVVGVVLFSLPGQMLVDIVSDIKISPGAAAQIVDKNANLIAHPDINRVLNGHNSVELAKKDPTLQPIADLEAKQANGESGFGTYTMSGVEKFLAYAPIPNTDGWSIGVNAPTSEFMETNRMSIRFTIAILVGSVVLSLAIALLISRMISKPVVLCANRLMKLADGNISEPVPASKSKDETGVLLNSLGTCVDRLQEMINDISYHLSEMADGNLTTEVEVDYVGEFINIKQSLELIIQAFRKLLGEVVSAANQVSSASDQVSSASQMLAQSSTEESQNMEMLGHSLEEISSRTEETAQSVTDASQLGTEMQNTAKDTNGKMNEMIEAVQEIREASDSIGRVIKVIEDIAFQTNILALNAAVEAARAGVHGKGFAVVAEEVGDLASKSAEAAKNTADLINDTIEKSERGFNISRETSESINEIVDGIQKTAEVLSVISEGSEIQSKEITSINTAIEEQIKVVHQNSATSEETAATSQQMSAQANQLLSLVSRFRIDAEEA